MVEDRISRGDSMAAAIQGVEEYLLPIEEQRAKENLRAIKALGEHVKIIGMPPELLA